MKRVAIGVGAGLIVLVAVAVFIVKGSAGSVAGLSSAIGESRATPAGRPLLERKELALHGGKGLVLAVREPVTSADVQVLVDANKFGYALVRVFTYSAAAQVGKDPAAGLYEWTVGEGLARRY